MKIISDEILKENEILKLALQEIINPVKFMINRLLPDEDLNGIAAVQLSNDPEYLKSIAKKAIEKCNT